MVSRLKRFFYFFVAGYFRFFAAIRLRHWQPKIIVITGSSGKTTLLHMVETQFGGKAIYSHHANSAFGIPFHILGLERKSFSLIEWPIFFIRAPFQLFTKLPEEKIYVVEADCERPREGQFLAELLRPHITLWGSLSRTHSRNFVSKQGETIEQATAHEFGYFIEKTQDLVLVNGDVPEIIGELSRTKAKKVIEMRPSEELSSYQLTKSETHFIFKDGETIQVPALVPKEVAVAVCMTKLLCSELGIIFNPSFPGFHLPPSRGTILQGINGLTIIDSSYNASLKSMVAMLTLFKEYPAEHKWLVLGDMIELGAYEREEHEKLAQHIIAFAPERVVLVGPRLHEYTYPILFKSDFAKDIVSFETPKEALEYLKKNIQGGEALLFKGARFLEGVIEHLLYNTNDRNLLCRRGKIWDDRRAQWGL